MLGFGGWLGDALAARGSAAGAAAATPSAAPAAADAAAALGSATAAAAAGAGLAVLAPGLVRMEAKLRPAPHAALAGCAAAAAAGAGGDCAGPGFAAAGLASAVGVPGASLAAGDAVSAATAAAGAAALAAFGASVTEPGLDAGRSGRSMSMLPILNAPSMSGPPPVLDAALVGADWLVLTATADTASGLTATGPCCVVVSAGCTVADVDAVGAAGCWSLLTDAGASALDAAAGVSVLRGGLGLTAALPGAVPLPSAPKTCIVDLGSAAPAARCPAAPGLGGTRATGWCLCAAELGAVGARLDSPERLPVTVGPGTLGLCTPPPVGGEPLGGRAAICFTCPAPQLLATGMGLLDWGLGPELSWPCSRGGGIAFGCWF